MTEPAAPAAAASPAVVAAVETPDGPFTVIVQDGAVLASGWTEDREALQALVHPTLRPRTLEEAGDDDERLAFALDAVRRYYAGETDAPSHVRVRQVSTEFRTQAWEALRSLAPGAPVTYATYAELAGRPSAVRAAAGACSANAAALFVPCHRVISSGGGLGGFRYGTPLKERLLRREAV